MNPFLASDPRALRQALGQFATGVTIVSCVDRSGRPVGLTVNSFNSLSLEPPLILWSLRRESPSLGAFEGAMHFAVNVLGEAQVELSRRFASPRDDKFEDVAWHAGVGGAPVLAGCAAALQCEVAARQDAGDHRLYIGRVLALSCEPVPPLVFHAGRYHLLGEIL
ncbi:MAG TPA: flavin reductase family protein [Burkholderiaceae bacterium]|nr:flavin reductase family protein [Burkholderiaceae bacterium]